MPIASTPRIHTIGIKPLVDYELLVKREFRVANQPLDQPVHRATCHREIDNASNAEQETHSTLSKLVQSYAREIDSDGIFINNEILNEIENFVWAFVKQMLSTTQDGDKLLNEMVLNELYECLAVDECVDVVESDLCESHTAVLEYARTLYKLTDSVAAAEPAAELATE